MFPTSGQGLEIRPHHWRKKSHGDAPGVLMMPIPGGKTGCPGWFRTGKYMDVICV